jgi:transposase
MGIVRPYAAEYDLRCCYEASSCGYVLHRWLKDANIACDVIAPSLIPRRAGRRVKTDRIDALKLASLYRAGELTSVRVPTREEESDRRLVRMHDQLTKDITETKVHINQFLRELEHVYRDGTRWTARHWAWLKKLSFKGSDATIWSEYLGLLEYKMARLAQIDKAIAELALTPKYAKDVKVLCCLRGIGILTAMVLLTEVVDFSRFPTAAKLMAYFGVVPSENSSGGTQRQGAITKTGNAHCRRVLIEAAHKYTRKPHLSKNLKARQEGQPGEIVAHCVLAQHRLYKKYWSIANRKAPQKATVAVARELAGFIWAIMTEHCSQREPKAVVAPC